mgnify:CR=1 FL=1
MPQFIFMPKWKEELVCSCDSGQLVFEMPMGRVTVLFPTEDRWNEIIVPPHWARTRRGEILTELEDWCRNEGIPLVVTYETLPTDPT